MSVLPMRNWMQEQMYSLLDRIKAVSERLEKQFDSMIETTKAMSDTQKNLISDIDKLQKATTTKPSHDRLE